MKVLVLVACLAAALADVPREIKEKQTVVEALPNAFQVPANFDESKGPFHFTELRSLKPIVAEKSFGTQQTISNVDVKEYQGAQPAITAYNVAADPSSYVVKTFASKSAPITTEYHVHEYQQPSSTFVKSVQEQVPVSAFQETVVSSQPVDATVQAQAEKLDEKLIDSKSEKIEKFEKVEGESEIKSENTDKVATAYTGGYEHSTLIQKQPALATLDGYKPVLAQSSYSTSTKEIVSGPATTTYVVQPAIASTQQTSLTHEPVIALEKKEVSQESAPGLVSTYTSSFPTTSAFKKESTVYSQTGYVAQPAVSSYKQVISSAAPVVTGYSQESVFGQTGYVAQPAVSSYKQVISSAAPVVSGYKQESVFAQPAVSSYEKEVISAPTYVVKEVTNNPAVSSYNTKFVSTPAVSTYTNFPSTSTFEKKSSVFGQSSFVAQPAITAYKQDTVYTSKPAVSTYTKEVVSPAASHAIPAYKKEFTSAPVISTYTTSLPGASGVKESSAFNTYSSFETHANSFPAGPAVKKESSVFSQTGFAADPVVSSNKQVISPAPAVTGYRQESVLGYSGNYVQPAVSSYKQVIASPAPVVTGYKQESIIAQPAVSSYKQVIPSAVPVVTGYSQESVFGQTGYVARPAVSSYKQVISSAAPAVTGYKQESILAQPAVSSYKQVISSAAPVVTGYKQESVFAQPAVSSYKQVISSPAPVVTGYKQESILAQPAVSSYKQVISSAAPVVTGYKQESILAQPAVSSFKKEVIATPTYVVSDAVNNPVVSSYNKEVVGTPVVSTYTNFPSTSTYEKKSSVFGQSSFVAQPAVSSHKESIVYSAEPSVTTYKQGSVYNANPAVSSYKSVVSASPAFSAFNEKSSFHKSSPVVSTYGASSLYGQSGSTFQKGSLLYSQPGQKYGGVAMFPGHFQSSVDGTSTILNLYNEEDGSGIYKYGYATSNGINFNEEGKVFAPISKSGGNQGVGASAVTGSYSYVGPDGVTYTVKYIADEHGFRAFGDHLPRLTEEAQHAIDEGAKNADKYDEEGNLKHHY